MLEDSTYTDAAVVAKSRDFHWVTVLRDSTPEITERFNVSVHPSLMVINKNQEKVYRFSGYKQPAPFIEELDEALRRYRLYSDGEEWDIPAPRPNSFIDAGRVETLDAPSEEVPSGITILNEDLWVSQFGTLFRLDLNTMEVKDEYEVGPSVRGICTDGKVLYGMEYGWTAAKPTHVIDPRDGRVIRDIVTEENSENKFFGAHAITWRRSSLYILSSFGISEVDPRTGEILRNIEPEERGLTALTWNGEHFVAGSREALFFIDPDSGRTVRSIPVNYPVRVIYFHEGVYYLMEQPVFGYNKTHERIRVWPEKTLIYKVRLP